jgi:hypothetical protein
MEIEVRVCHLLPKDTILRRCDVILYLAPIFLREDRLRAREQMLFFGLHMHPICQQILSRQ